MEVSPDKIRAVISKALSVPMEKVTPEASIVQDLGADSLDVAELSISLQEELGIDLTDEQLARIKTVQDVIDVAATPPRTQAHLVTRDARPLHPPASSFLQ